MKLAAGFLLLLGVASANAATVLYQTDWESAPASPPWAPGLLPGHNGWFGQNNLHQVVANGSGVALGVTTPYGSQFVRLMGDPGTVSRDSFAWPDISSAFASRPAGFNIIKASFDVYVPSSQATDGTFYGILAFHEMSAPWGLFVEGDDRSINLVINNTYKFVPAAFAFNTWFNIAVIANYTTGGLSVEKNGVLMALSATNFNILSGSLQDVDLWSSNDPTPTSVRTVFIDNYRVTASSGEVVPPRLTIQPGPPAPIGDPPPPGA
jgi:hypothetical protein